MTLLISKSDILAIVPLSESGYSAPFFDEQIRNAQESDLRRLMGDALYFTMIKNITDERFVNILNEKDFVAKDGNTYYSYGIKSALIHYTMARYFYYGQEVDTPFGYAVKEADIGRRIGFNEKKDQYNERQRLAYEKWETVERYIRENTSVYPEFLPYSTHQPRSFGTLKLVR